MLPFNTMRYVTDTFSLAVIAPPQALLIANTALNTNGYCAVKSINISGNEPIGTARRFMFKIDGNIYRFVEGSLTQYTKAASLANVLADGNSAAELAAITDFSSLLDKNISPIIALSAPSDAVALPSAKFSITLQRQL